MEDDLECIMVVVKSVTGDLYDLVVDRKGTVADVKEAFEDQHEIPAEEQRLIYKGCVLNQYMSLDNLGVREGDTLYYSRSKKEKPQQLTLPKEETPDPQNAMMAPILDMLGNNPEMMRSMMTAANPNLSKAMETNPQIAAVMNDPNTMKQAAEMMRNPGLMQEMSRNMDRQVTQIMNTPGGSQHLERAFHDLESTGPTLPEMHFQPSIPAPPPNIPLPNPWSNQQPVMPVVPQAIPQQDYSSQLRYMNEMGFNDNHANLLALQATNGDVDSAVNRLLNK
eukprot:TRINITY_DN5661_c1_g1_i1.p1 TRINITY_DN5661_c1_g1~~TRINITY_DN5661_c1_g1_i1.p1  ORF type:complete len:306 (+),score=79.74 TRINITY_DN5661_c1_g1_i1:82-918(+)